MSVKIRFRFNKLTGEVEQFLVEQERELPAAEHDASHEEVAGAVGRLIDRFPAVEIAPGAAVSGECEPVEADAEPVVKEPDRRDTRNQG